MAHWSDAYVGREYSADDFDCSDLAQTVASEVLGRTVHLPPHHARTPFGRNVQIRAYRDDLAARVSAPSDGHPVVLLARGRMQHLGVMCWIGGAWWVLHADDGFGEVIRQRLRRGNGVDSVDGCVVEGYYEWK